MDHSGMYSLPSACYNGDILLLVDLSLLWSCQDAWFNESDLAVMGLCRFFPLLSLRSRPLSLPPLPRWPHLPFHVTSSDTDCKPNPDFQRCCVKWARAGPELAVPRLLPVMVGDDGSQSSHTYSVAHQMDFLTQNAFKPGRSKPQHEPLSASRHSLGLKEKSSLTFHLAAARLQRWGTRGARHQWRPALPWWKRRNTSTQQLNPSLAVLPGLLLLLLLLPHHTTFRILYSSSQMTTDTRTCMGADRQPTGWLNLDEPIVQGWRRYRLYWVGIRHRTTFWESGKYILRDKRPCDWRQCKTDL